MSVPLWQITLNPEIVAPQRVLTFVLSKAILDLLIPAMYLLMPLPLFSLYGAWLYQPLLTVGATSLARKLSVRLVLRVPTLVEP